MTNEQLERKLTEWRDLSERRAQAKAELTKLEHYRRSKLAMLMKSFAGEFTSSAAQEREARAHPEYQEVLDGLAEATESFEKLDWELRISMKGSDLWQTTEATRREEMRAYGRS